MKAINKKKIDFFRTTMLQWFGENGRQFPWRNKSTSNYKKIISEVLLQRTKAETVAKYFTGFLERYPNWKRLADASVEELEFALKPYGLYKQRAKRVAGMAAEMNIRNGRLPKEPDEIKRIPMFGQYITNSIMLLIHGKPYPLLDVNMSRVLERFFGPRQMSDIRYDPYLQSLSFKIVKCPEPWKINWGILDFAASVCKARQPICDECPINSTCKFYKETKNPKEINYLFS